MTEAGYWIGLSLVPEVGPVMSKKLLSAIGSPENIFRAGTRDLLSVGGLRRETADNIKNFRLWDTVEQYLKDTERKCIHVVGYHDPAYPEVLREVEGSPIVLYMKGQYVRDDRFGIAVVGSRKHTDYGEAVTKRLSGELASAGFTIISGMARGIDTISHMSALSSAGRTIAVLGCGPDVAYPSENRRLMERITESGCVISEFPPGTRPNKENFPRRNRIISALSLGVLVVEAAADSGSLITARYALEQNKEVFAVPGNITSLNSGGTNGLIRQGAKTVLGAEDIIEELGPLLRGFIRAAKERQPVDISAEEEKLCSFLTREPKHVDIISRESSDPAHRILEILLSLELKGIVQQTTGKRFYLR